MCKAIKGTYNSVCKTHNTKNYRSKVYYKKRMLSSHKDETPYKKSKTCNRTSLAIKKGIKKIKKCLARRDAGYISSSDSDSD